MLACAEVSAVECRDALAAHVEYVDACKCGIGGGEGYVRAVHVEPGLCCKCDRLDCVRSDRCAVFVVKFDACDVSCADACCGEQFRFLVESADDFSVVCNHVVEEYESAEACGAAYDQGDGEEVVQIHRLFVACGIFVGRDVEFASALGAVVEPAAVRGGLFPGPFLVFGAVADESETDPDAVVFATGAFVFDFDGDALCAGQVGDFLEFDVSAAVVECLERDAHEEIDVFRIGLGCVCTELGVLRRCRADVRGCCSFVIVIPTRHFVEGDDAFVSEVLCPHVGCGLAYIASVPARRFVPRHPPAPSSAIFVHLFDVRNRAVLAEGDNLVGAGLVREVNECGAVALVVIGFVVNVNAQHVIVGFARSPRHRGGILRIEVPNEVVHSVREYHAFVK